jgi:hypothetical protein
MSNHTPGPWRVGDAGATVFGPPRKPRLPEIIATCRNRENTRLIAAAPELLEVCRAVMDPRSYDDNGESYQALFDKARAAVAKAEGRLA